jgi:hypothetical protein
LLDHPENATLDGAVCLAETSLLLEELSHQTETIANQLLDLAAIGTQRVRPIRDIAENIAFNSGNTERVLRYIEDRVDGIPNDLPPPYPNALTLWYPSPPLSPGDTADDPINLTSPIDDYLTITPTIALPDRGNEWVYCPLCQEVREPHEVAECHFAHMDVGEENQST